MSETNYSLLVNVRDNLREDERGLDFPVLVRFESQQQFEEARKNEFYCHADEYNLEQAAQNKLHYLIFALMECVTRENPHYVYPLYYIHRVKGFEPVTPAEMPGHFLDLTKPIQVNLSLLS